VNRPRRSPLLPSLAVLMVLSSCTAPPLACTDIGAANGIGVTVVAELAPEIEGLTLTICRAGGCQEAPVELSAGSVTVGETCTGSAPDDVCSASSAPDGTTVGFVPVEDLAEESVAVTARYRRSGRSVSEGPVELTARGVYPNGPDCGPGGYQAAVRLSASGLEIAR
jgi:hypothetical protein